MYCVYEGEGRQRHLEDPRSGSESNILSMARSELGHESGGGAGGVRGEDQERGGRERDGGD